MPRCKKNQVAYRTPSGKRSCRKKRSACSYIRKSKRKSPCKTRKSPKKKSSKKKRKTRKDKGLARKPPAYPYHLDEEEPPAYPVDLEKEEELELTLENCVSKFSLEHIKLVAEKINVSTTGSKTDICMAIIKKMEKETKNL
jgi:hypothetical protein